MQGIIDYESFIAGVQVGRRLKVADAQRKLPPEPPVPPGLLILAEDGTPIITEHYQYTGNVSFFNCNERILRFIGRDTAYYYEMHTEEDGVQFFFANIDKDTTHAPAIPDPPQIVFVKDNLSGGSYSWRNVYVDLKTGAERWLEIFSMRTNMFDPAMERTDRGFLIGSFTTDSYPPGEIDFFEGTTGDELEAFIASADYKKLITEGEVIPSE